MGYRFVDFGEQIRGERTFGFYNTSSDLFVCGLQEHAFESWRDFVWHYINRDDKAKIIDLDRLKRLCPEWVFNVQPSEFADEGDEPEFDLEEYERQARVLYKAKQEGAFQVELEWMQNNLPGFAAHNPLKGRVVIEKQDGSRMEGFIK